MRTFAYNAAEWQMLCGRLRALREKASLSIRQVNQQTGLSVEMIGSAETKTWCLRNAGLGHLEVMLTLYGSTLGEFFAGGAL